ncbi:MAG: leucyl aminopeptidase family protein [Pseudobdellovibrionaceae bacterium]
MKSLLDSVQLDSPGKKRALKTVHPQASVYVLGEAEKDFGQHVVSTKSHVWQTEDLLKTKSSLVHFQNEDGITFVVFYQKTNSDYGFYRDAAGSVLSSLRLQKIASAGIVFKGLSADQELGFLVGLDLAAYQYRKSETKNPFEDFPAINVSDVKLLKEAKAMAKSINLARHLVNLPPNLLFPSAFVHQIKALSFSKASKVEVWNVERLKKEKMNLLLAVGKGAENPPCFIHIRYRPVKMNKNSRPIAFVGKGITFDTGGLDIKPSTAMRLMKKDMGGAASVLALAYWVDQMKYDRPCDFYLALAENGVDGKAFRPSDVIVSKAGYSVEIDNTDAEGRLVLADALCVAVSQVKKDEPEFVIDVATLTGAIKVALGAEVAGLFSNNNSLADELLKSSERFDDQMWRMPLVAKYFQNLSSPFADFKNSADGFGGAITAALFLEKFVQGKNWAHLDIYAWADRANGAITSAGGNGQAVQALIGFLKNRQS